MEKKIPTTKPKLQEEQIKQVRATVCNLLSIWREFEYVNVLLIEEGPNNQFIFQNDELKKKHLDIDRDKIENLTENHKQCLEEIKQINVALYFTLENALLYFNRNINEHYYPIFQDKAISNDIKNKLLIHILSDCLHDLKDTIHKTCHYLPSTEADAIIQLMAEYSIRIKKQISTIALDHFVSWINLIIPLEGLITTESINKIMSNKTILWIISKVNDSGILKKAFQDKTTEPIKLILALKNENNSILNSLIQLIKDQKTIQKLSITEAEEHNYIIGNSEFRDTLMAIIEIIFGTVPAQQRYEIDEIFSGKISFREILGKQE